MKSQCSPLINGNLIIDQNGIGKGIGNFELSLFNEKQNIICFCFMFIKFPIAPHIKFGIKTSSEVLIEFDLATFLYSLRSERINPPISYDGIDTCIRMFYHNPKMYLYVNDVKLNYAKDIANNSFSFFLSVVTTPNSEAILATPFHNNNHDSLDRFSIYFPKSIHHFWHFEDKNVITQSDNFVAFTNDERHHTIISDELSPLPGSDIIYFEITVHSFDPNSIFRIGMTNRAVVGTETIQDIFDSVPYFSYPDQNFILSDSDESSDLVIHEGSVIGFGIQKFYENKSQAEDVIFFIIDGIEYDGHFLNEEEEDANEESEHQHKKKKGFCCRKHFYAFVVSSSDIFQFTFNAGSKPFRYIENLRSSYNISMPIGWSIYYPCFQNKWIKGIPPDRHVLNMFCPPNFERKWENCIIYQDAFKNRGCFEVKLLELEFGASNSLPPFKKGEETVSVGLAPFRYQTDQPLGYFANSYAINSINGNIFAESSNEIITDLKKIKSGSCIMTQIDGGDLTFFVDGTEIEVPNGVKNTSYPAIGFSASPCFIVNFGQSPFYHLPSLGKYQISKSQNSTKTEINLNSNHNLNSPHASSVPELNNENQSTQNNQFDLNTENQSNQLNLRNENQSNQLDLRNENQSNNHIQLNSSNGNLRTKEKRIQLSWHKSDQNLPLDLSNQTQTEDDDDINFDFESDIIFDQNIRLHADSTNDDFDTMTLFNNVVVTINKNELNDYGLEIGDIIESRDRRFRGTVAGVLNKRIYCYIEKYDGAFPLVETDPIDVMITYRILNRRKKIKTYPVISSFEFVDLNVSNKNFHRLYATENGLAIFLGSTNNRKFVFRPISDFYNNDLLIFLNEMPPNIFDRVSRIMPFPVNSDPNSNLELTSSFYIKTDQNLKDEKKIKIDDQKSFKFLDVILYDPIDLEKKKKNEASVQMELDKHPLSYALVFGRRGDNYVAWDGKEIIDVPSKAKIQFESFCSFGSRRSFKGQGKLLNGLADSGFAYPFSFNGFLGTKMISKSHKNQRYFNSTGGSHAPPIFQYLITTLNETKLYNYSIHDESKNLFEILKGESPDDALPFETYTANEVHFQAKSKLITEFDFVGGSLYKKDKLYHT